MFDEFRLDFTMKVFVRQPLNFDTVSLPRGQVYLIPSRCKGCRLCIQFCPQKVLRESENTNQKGYHYPEVVDGGTQECVNCEFCTLICPEFAIFSLPAGMRAGSG